MNNSQTQTEDPKQISIEAIVTEQVKTIAHIINKVRHSQDINIIFQETTQEARRVLQSDRLVVYQFNPDWGGQVVAESVGAGWVSLIIEQDHDDVLNQNRMQKDRCLLRVWAQGEYEQIFEPDTFLQETGGGSILMGKNIPM